MLLDTGDLPASELSDNEIETIFELSYLTISDIMKIGYLKKLA